MPRETIGAHDEQFVVRIGWQADREVQIGIEQPEGRSLFWTLLANRAEHIGAEVRRIVAEANEPGTQPLGDTKIGEQVLNMLDTSASSYAGVWSTLGRHECNQVIRVLRRARDQAYGRDE